MKTFDEYFSRNYIDRYCFFRTYYAGLHVGKLVIFDVKSGNAFLEDARRLWRWNSRFSLSEIARYGLTKADECKIACVVDKMMLSNIYEIIPCTEEAEKSLREIEAYEDKDSMNED